MWSRLRLPNERKELEMKRVLPTVTIVALAAVLVAAAFAAQDRYTLKVPGGLAFADFRGYGDWQTIAVVTTVTS